MTRGSPGDGNDVALSSLDGPVKGLCLGQRICTRRGGLRVRQRRRVTAKEVLNSAWWESGDG